MRRLLGTALAAAMLVSSVPSYVYAEEDTVQQSAEASEVKEEAKAVKTESQKPETEKKADEKKADSEEKTQEAEKAAADPAKADNDAAKSDTQPVKADTDPAKADTEPAKADTDPVKADTEPTENDAQPTESDTAPVQPDAQPTEDETPDTKTVAVQDAVQNDQLLQYAGNGTYEGTSVAEDVLLVPGTYTVTANLYLTGGDNAEQKDVTLYLTSRESGQTEQVTKNATLTVAEDGVTKTLVVPVKNAGYTLQKLGGGKNASVSRSAWDSKTYKNTAGDTVSGRMTEVTVKLNDNSGKYTFTDCTLFPTKEDKKRETKLVLGVDLASVPQMKDLAMTGGDKAEWHMGSTEGLVFICEGDPADLTSVSVDGQTLDKTQYTLITQGTTGIYIQLAASYLSTLAVKSHSVTIRTGEGLAKCTFTVLEAVKDDTTDDNQKDADALAPGTYRITANLYLPGELNTQLPGTTAYLTNPDNPLGLGGHNGIPMTPVKDNATLIVGQDGKMTVEVDVVNPVFTLQKITSGSAITVLGAVRDKEIYAGVSQTVTRMGRITKLYLELKDHSGVYQFGACTEFPTLLETDWHVPLQLSVDFTSAVKTADSADVKVPDNATSGTETPDADQKTDGKTDNTTDTKTNPDAEDGKDDTDTDPDSGKGTLKPGTYTVAANIWIDKASSGLPLNPHLTSSVFPPKDPVSNNAKVTIDKKGNATVKVPIVIQSKVMSIKSISGLKITKSSKSGGYLTSITVDLGKVTNPNAVITKKCTVSLDLGELAQTIAKKDKEQTWGATFQVNFSGIPSGSSGGGSVDVNALIADAEKDGAADAESQTATNIRIGMRADIYSAPYFPLMKEHKDDTKIKETKTVQTGVENSYLFTLEQLEETDETKAMTEEEQTKALSEQYLGHFADGTYDLIVATPEEVETLCQDVKTKDSFLVLSMNTYEQHADGTRLLLVKKSFTEAHAAVLEDILTKVEKSSAEALNAPEQTAVTMVSLGMGTDSAAVQELLQTKGVQLLTGTEMQTAVAALAEDTTLADLKDDKLCYIPVAKADGAEQTTEAAATEKTEITDADSLSAALDKALAEKSGETDSQTTTDGTFSNSSGLDLDAEKKAAEALKAGTYTVSVNLYLPGERNTQLPGTTAYMTNPDNPLGVGGHEGIPMTPVTGNGTLVVGADGTKTVTVDVVNPVFTLQSIASPVNSKILAGVKDSERYEGTNKVGVDGRITQLVIELGDDSGLYAFDDCREFPTLLETDWTVPLEMSVEFTSAEKTSDSTEVTVPEDSAGMATK